MADNELKCVSFYELDQKVFAGLSEKHNEIKNWYGKASGISDYVATWGMVRFWAMSRSQVSKGGKSKENNGEAQSYFAWNVAREVLCEIVGNNLGIELEEGEILKDIETARFHKIFYALNFNKQLLLIDLLIEISETIQFWSVRMKEVSDLNEKLKARENNVSSASDLEKV